MFFACRAVVPGGRQYCEVGDPRSRGHQYHPADRRGPTGAEDPRAVDCGIDWPGDPGQSRRDFGEQVICLGEIKATANSRFLAASSARFGMTSCLGWESRLWQLHWNRTFWKRNRAKPAPRIRPGGYAAKARFQQWFMGRARMPLP